MQTLYWKPPIPEPFLFPYHWHDALEIIQVLKGSVNISIGPEELG